MGIFLNSTCDKGLSDMRRGVKNSDMGRRIVTCDLLPTIVKITFLNCDAVTQTIQYEMKDV